MDLPYSAIEFMCVEILREMRRPPLPPERKPPTLGNGTTNVHKHRCAQDLHRNATGNNGTCAKQ